MLVRRNRAVKINYHHNRNLLQPPPSQPSTIDGPQRSSFFFDLDTTSLISDVHFIVSDRCCLGFRTFTFIFLLLRSPTTPQEPPDLKQLIYQPGSHPLLLPPSLAKNIDNPPALGGSDGRCTVPRNVSISNLQRSVTMLENISISNLPWSVTVIFEGSAD